jgi:hypothetical protein
MGGTFERQRFPAMSAKGGAHPSSPKAVPQSNTDRDHQTPGPWRRDVACHCFPDTHIYLEEMCGVSVYDSKNQRVTQEAALTSPERIGAIYFQSTSTSNTSYCGSFSQGAVAFREFVLGNIGMVQSWSLATPEITSRLSSDIETLTAFQAELPCLAVPEQASWSAARVFTATLGAAVELAQTYSHYHVHVIPVYETDERARPARVLSWSEGVVVYDDAEAARICRDLAQSWPRAAVPFARSAE